MKIGIITMNGYLNIGNRLQNYAVQELLKDRGHETVTIHHALYDYDADIKTKIKNAGRNLMERCGFYSSTFYLSVLKKNPRMILLRDFDREYVQFSRKYLYKTNCMHKYKDDFDYYCAGSDQVWNASLVQNRGFFFMNFAEPEKAFSFAASMGTTHIPEQFLSTYEQGFNHVKNISVREDSVADLIYRMTGKSSTVLLDPTLLLSRDKWRFIAKKPAGNLPQKYIATYFLSSATAAQKAFIEKYAKSNGAKVVDINGSYKNCTGPLEFIHLIANADFIFTDSFHGTAFSIIFQKPFLVFQRNNTYDMSSRITTILNKFQIGECFVNIDNNTVNDSLLANIDLIQRIDYKKVNELLSLERDKANKFLDGVFQK